MTENPGKLVPLGIVHNDDRRDQLMRLIEVRWQEGRLALWGRRKDTSHPFEKINEYRGLELLWMAGPEREDYYCDVGAHPRVVAKRGYSEHLWEELQIREDDLKLLCDEIAEVAPGTKPASQPTSILLIESVHDRGAGRRQKSRIDATAKPVGEPFPHWDDPSWDQPVTLLDALRRWAPGLMRRLDQLTLSAPERIRDLAHQRDIQNLALQFRRKGAEPPRSQRADDIAEPPHDDPHDFDNHGMPESLRDAWTLMEREWNHWDEVDRLVHAYELACRLIIEKTRRGQRYGLICAPGTSRDDARLNYKTIDQASHDKLAPYDFDLRTSYLRRHGGNWFARISSGIDAQAERMRSARLEREEWDVAAAEAWAAILGKPFRERGLFGFVEIAEHLTRKSVVDPEWAKRDIVILDLDDWTRRQEFELSGESDVVIKIEEPPFSRPFGPADIGKASVEPEGLKIQNAQLFYLRRPACRRYIEANLSLGNAPRLLRDWFPETSTLVPPPSYDNKVTQARQKRSVDARLHAAIQAALKSLGSPGSTVQWKPFCDQVRATCQATAQTRGYGDRSIQRIVKTIAVGNDKPDK